jgi:hypothetical protein
VAAISRQTVMRTGKSALKLHLSKCSVLAPEHNAEFVACMEDVPDVSRRTCDLQRPVACLDEQPCPSGKPA